MAVLLTIASTLVVGLERSRIVDTRHCIRFVRFAIHFSGCLKVFRICVMFFLIHHIEFAGFVRFSGRVLIRHRQANSAHYVHFPSGFVGRVWRLNCLVCV